MVPRRFLPDEVAGVEDRELTVGHPLLEELGGRDWDDAIVAAGDDRDMSMQDSSSASPGSCCGYVRA